MDERTASLLASACSRSAVHPDAFFPLRQLFGGCKLIRLSFGLQNKVMLSITIDLESEGQTHASYVPIHPTAAAAAVLQNNPVVVVRQDKRSPLWDQEDLYQREGCTTLNVVSMPFYWPPRPGSMWEGAPLPVPQNPGFHPTFGALTVAGHEPLTQESMQVLLELAAMTGRHVGPHISMLLASLEGAGLLPGEAEAQEELSGLLDDEGELDGEEGMDGLFDVEDAHAAAEADALLPGLSALATAPGDFPDLEAQQRRAEAAVAAAHAADADFASPASASVPIPDWLLHDDSPDTPGGSGSAQPGGPRRGGLPGGSPHRAGGVGAAGVARTGQSTEELLLAELRAAGLALVQPDVGAAEQAAATPGVGAPAVDADSPTCAVATASALGDAAAAAPAGGPAAVATPDADAATPVAAAVVAQAPTPPAAPPLSTHDAEHTPSDSEPPVLELAAAPKALSDPNEAAAGAAGGAGPAGREEDRAEQLAPADAPPVPVAADGQLSEQTVDPAAAGHAAAAPASPAAAMAAAPAGLAVPPRGGGSGGSSTPSATVPTPNTTDGSPFSFSGSGLAAVTAGGGGVRCPWSNISFQQAGLERAFAMHYSRRQQRMDMLTLAVVVLTMLCAAAARLEAAWPAGVAAVLLFTPYFVDSRLYYNAREALVSGATLLLSVFLSSLQKPSAPPGAFFPANACAARAAELADGAGNGPSCSAAPYYYSHPGAGAAAGGSAFMAGFGICWFVLHTCGLCYLVAAPLVLWMRTSRALPVQACCLALALMRLPAAYAGVLGQLDTVHVLLLGLLLILGAAAGLGLAQTLEWRRREEWLARRRRRAAATMAAAASASTSSVSH